MLPRHPMPHRRRLFVGGTALLLATLTAWSVAQGQTLPAFTTLFSFTVRTARIPTVA